MFRNSVILIFLTLVYFVAGKLGLLLAFEHVSASPVWPPTGIAIAAFFLVGTWIWPAVFIGAFFVNLTTAGSVATTLGIAAGNTLEGILAVYFIRRFIKGSEIFNHPRNIYAYVLLVVFVSPVVSATIGVTSLALGGYATWSGYPTIWLTWWLGDAIGALIVAPPIILWSRNPPRKEKMERVPETILAFTLVLLVGQIIFNGFLPASAAHYPIEFLCVPLFLWIALRFSQREGTLAILVFSTIAISGTLYGYGPFAIGIPNESLLLLQSFMGVIASATLTLTAVIVEQKRAERELKKNEKSFRALIEHSYDAIALVDAHGTILYASPSTETILGYAPDEFVGLNAFTIIHPEDQQSTQKKLAEAIQKPGHIVTAEYRIQHKDGRWRWMAATGNNMLREPGIGAVVVNYQDITERKKTEESLSYLAAIVSSSDDAIIAKTLDGIITSWNKTAEQLFGYTDLGIIGQPISTIIPPDRLDEEKELSQKIRNGERIKHFETVRKHKDGRRIDVSLTISPIKDTEGRVIGASKIARDVSERKQYVENLKTRTRELEFAKAITEQEKSKIETILSSIGDGVFVVDFQCNIVMMNTIAQTISGYTPEEAKGRYYSSIFELSYEKNREKPFPLFIEEVIKSKTLKEVTNHTLLTRRDGTKIPISYIAAPLIDRQGIVFGCVVILRDVSRERELDQAKDEFLSLAAHELRTPLGIIRWNTEILLHGHKGPLSEEIKTSLTQQYESILRLITLVNDLLNVSRIEQGRDKETLQLCNLVEIISRVIKEMDNVFKKHDITIQFTHDQHTLLQAVVDPKHFHQVIQNILSNAIKYTHPHTAVVVELHKSDHSVLISIKDAGIGIPKLDQERIFSKFFRGSNAIQHDAQGSGLGLSVVKYYIERWNGTIRFESEENKGTVFHIQLPVNEMWYS